MPKLTVSWTFSLGIYEVVKRMPGLKSQFKLKLWASEGVADISNKIQRYKLKQSFLIHIAKFGNDEFEKHN
jgi:hypothetical protein